MCVLRSFSTSFVEFIKMLGRSVLFVVLAFFTFLFLAPVTKGQISITDFLLSSSACQLLL